MIAWQSDHQFGNAAFMATPFKYVGRSYPAPDAASKVSGTLVYGTDLRLPGMLYAQLVLSPHAHAKVGSIDKKAALAVPGVVGVYCHHNAPSTAYCRYRIMPGQAGCIEDETLFASTARFVGDRIAAVVASSLEAAREAARLIEVNYTELAPVLSAEAALEPTAARVHPGGNLVHEFEYAAGEPAELPAGAMRTSTTVHTQMLHHAAIEPHTCLANFDSAHKLTIWSPCQSVYGACTVVADLLGLPYNRVRVVKVPMGGSFGGKQEFILEPGFPDPRSRGMHPLDHGSPGTMLGRTQCSACRWRTHRARH
jgi:CO/xanthine dehydrogenase Mo-binding subunit